MTQNDLPDIPDDALISIPVLQKHLKRVSYIYLEDGYFAPLPGEELTLPHDHIAAILADKCPVSFLSNGESSDLDAFFTEIPCFYLSEAGWRQAKSGFWFVDPFALRGKVGSKTYLLAVNPDTKMYLWQNGRVEFLLREDHAFHSGIEMTELADKEIIEMGPYYLMRTLLDGVLSDSKLHKLLAKNAGGF